MGEVHLTQIREEINGTTSNNAYPRFSCNYSFLAANSLYIIPAGPQETSLNLRHHTSIPADAGDNPVNEWDPHGMDSVEQECWEIEFATPLCGWLSEHSGESGKSLVSSVGHNVKYHFVEHCSQTGSLMANGLLGPDLQVTYLLPPVIIPSDYGMEITVQSDVSIAGPDQSLNINLNSDGSISIGSGNTSVNFSADGALQGLTEGNVSVSPDGGISYTDTVKHKVSSDNVLADITLTVKPSGTTLPGSISPNLKTGAEVAGAGVGVGIIIWWAFKPGCILFGPFAPACVAVA